MRCFISPRQRHVNCFLIRCHRLVNITLYNKPHQFCATTKKSILDFSFKALDSYNLTVSKPVCRPLDLSFVRVQFQSPPTITVESSDLSISTLLSSCSKFSCSIWFLGPLTSQSDGFHELNSITINTIRPVLLLKT